MQGALILMQIYHAVEKKCLFENIDEVGCDKRNMLKKFGCSLPGERAICYRLLVRGTRVSALQQCVVVGCLVLK